MLFPALFASRCYKPSVFLLATFWVQIIISSFALSFEIDKHNTIESFDQLKNLALEKVLLDASPIFGAYKETKDHTSEWMKDYPDDKLLVHMNLPGTHDSQTWNYSPETRKKLNRITRLRGVLVAPARFYRCQGVSLVDMLNQGIRVFDLRFAFDVTKTVLVFWHGQALQSQTATVDSVLFAFYKWLGDHPTEAVLISLKYESFTTLNARNDEALQMAIFKMLTSKSAEKFFMKAKNELGTLGEARGRITLLRRFDLDLLPEEYEKKIPGVHFPPSKWTANGRNITFVYNTSQNQTVYIEDHFHLKTPFRAGLAYSIDLKYNVTVDHLKQAVSQNHDSLYWTFASGERNIAFSPQYPKQIALGSSEVVGMNQRLAKFFKTQKNTRLGITMFDFFDQPSDLIKSFLEIQAPHQPGKDI
ncbi:hypothetical protein K3495_g5627 [Podosphaera aphanis]|nr:hypothetical protein K3495_g5627 [Podosphaera aphanis]